MFRILLLVAVVFCIGLASGVYAQDAGRRTQELAAALDKTKYKKKEKRNITTEVYVDVKHEPVVRSSTGEYAGVYESSDSGYRLELRAASANGEVEGSGYDTVDFDNGQRASFTLKDARIDGALLTGTKVFENGASEKFEGVFANRTAVTGRNPNEITSRETNYGLGFIQKNAPADKSANWMNRVFLEFKR